MGASLLALAAGAVVPSIDGYRRSQKRLADFDHFRLVLDAANRLSAERGPANLALASAPGNPALAARLADLRTASDRQLAALREPEAAGTPGHRTYRLPEALVAATTARLEVARREVDRVAALAPAARPEAEIERAVAAMIAAAESFEEAVAWEAGALGRADAALAGPAVIGHLLGDLRDHAGRIASALVPAVVARAPLTPAQLDEALTGRSRVLEMRRVLHGQAAFGQENRLEAAMGEAEAAFFQRGLGIVGTVIAEGRDSGRYSLGGDEFMLRYVPTLRSLEELRHAYLGWVNERLAQEHEAAFLRLVLLSGGALALIGTVALLLRSLRNAVLRPLLAARASVIALAEERDPDPVRMPVRIREIARLFDALLILRERVRERTALLTTLRRQAETDGLTGLSNRRGLARALAPLAAAPDAAVMMIDLDGFKKVNDSLGHAAGDALIQQAGQRLVSCVGADGLVARMGGDEFAILLPGLSDPPAAGHTAEAILRSLAEPFRVEEQSLHLGASIGIALSPIHAPRPDDLLTCADMALSEAKRSGRHCHRVFTPAMRRAALRWTLRQQELPRALSAEEFTLVYQPQVRLRDRAVVGAEALLRWRHPEHGILNPAEFLPAVDGSRHAAAVGRWVLRKACAQAAAWRAAGAEGLRISINLFSAQFYAEDLVDEVRRALAEADLPGSALELEITETIVLGHDDALLAPLHALREMGVGLAFDDFGTGYASLSLLKRFPLTRLKIDRSFVQHLDASAQDQAIVGTVLMLGRSLDLAVIAEGVETEAACRQLIGRGCEEGQGYLFGRPVPAEEFAASALRAGHLRPLHLVGDAPF
ncbi:putative bifunctional diguanylate cyclase/phosphodiesterase [Methylobacterium sp. ID0610]|uniref:putative bifunctional diguanylate cyclase/phosphodiesterase n=1 Tax=Methylobacterium carpenticola TaxID=3344827 RepID=UPI0036790D18